MHRRAHSVKVLLALVLSSGVLIATSYSSAQLMDDFAVTLAPGETATGTILLSRRAARRTDGSYVEGTVSTPGASLDVAGPDAGAGVGETNVVITLDSLPLRIQDGFFRDFDHWAINCRDACEVPFTVTNEGAETIQVEFVVTVEDTSPSGGVLCGSGPNYPDDATLEIVVP